MFTGCYTALITPFINGHVDEQGLNRLIEFQLQHGISGILAAGTTGESPTLSWEEHYKVIECVANKTKEAQSLCIAGTGSNNTEEALIATKNAVEMGANAVLLVDPYYNGPSSLEIRREYVQPIAQAFPETTVIPYIIPGRTGTQLLPEDLAIAFQKYPNVNTVKESTGNLENMKRIRACCGQNFSIISGDDGMVYEMMCHKEINASGAISVVSNIIPKAFSDMIQHLLNGEQDQAQTIHDKIKPLFSIVTVTTKQETAFGTVLCKARNPLGIKTVMAVLGLPSGICRKPLGKMTYEGIHYVIDLVLQMNTKYPEILLPLAEFFNIDIHERLSNLKYREGLYYTSSYASD
ncbi:MAG: 4-hydroxy-tetrahydrodipicolinate synthase [Desulfobacterales bacterium]|nr:4-hydroxy-tetrahydrodipicolinate synthase [Desulfobacterales bacterium]